MIRRWMRCSPCFRLTENQELFLAVIAAALVVLVVSTIRKLCSTFAWEIAVGAGSAVYLLVMVLGALFMRLDIAALPLVAGRWALLLFH